MDGTHKDILLRGPIYGIYIIILSIFMLYFFLYLVLLALYEKLTRSETIYAISLHDSLFISKFDDKLKTQNI